MAGTVIGSVLSGMAAFLTLHVMIWRISPSDSPRIFLLVFLAGVGMGISLLVSLGIAGFNGFELCAVLWIDSFAVVLYMFVYAGLARSVSVTILSRLIECGGRPLDFDTLVGEYALSSRFDDRIQLMEKNGLVRFAADSVTLTKKGFALARAAKGLGEVFGSGLRG